MSGEVPEGWREAKLGDHCRIEIGGTPSRDKPQFWSNEDMGHPWVSIADLKTASVASTKEFISDLGVANSNVKLVPRGTVMMSFKLTIGRAAIAGRDLYTNEAIAAFFPDSRLDNEFLFYALPHAAGGAETDQAIKGATLNKAKLRDLSVPLPPLDEQRRIAEVLRSVDDAIVSAENCVGCAKSTLNALLSEYFYDADEAAKRGGWRPLRDLVSIQSGYAFKSADYQKNGHFLMRIGNVQDGYVSDENPRFVKLDEKTRSFELRVGDILTSLTGNIGRVARIHEHHLPAALNQRVARISRDENAPINIDYLFFALKSPLFKAGLAGESGGAAQQNVSPKAIGRIQIPLPSLTDQERIGKILLGIDDMIDRSSAGLENLKKLKFVIMSDLLSGRIRVPA